MAHTQPRNQLISTFKQGKINILGKIGIKTRKPLRK
jgi:hypothetical protein